VNKRNPVVQKIRLHILTNDLKFNKVAEDCGIEATRFYAILGGRAKVLPEEFAAIAKALGEPMEFFLPSNT
jgi:plasmid maintenance system antidote protein VapI